MTELAANGRPIESVWDYPRPPRVEPVDRRIQVIHGGVTVVDAAHAVRVLETSQPPAYYVPAEFVDLDLLRPSAHRTMCEWKGVAEYADIVVPGVPVVEAAAWCYPAPVPEFADLVRTWAFYAQRLDSCLVDGEAVAANDGGFYGGWITAEVTGPFKGAPGTLHW